MAYAQWVVIKITTVDTNLSLKNVKLPWGKFYAHPDKDKEIKASAIAKMVVTPENPVVIASCGRSDSASGTEGSFELYDGAAKVAKYYWSCPWGSKTNTSTLTPGTNDKYVVQAKGANLDSGALGNVKITCVKTEAPALQE